MNLASQDLLGIACQRGGPTNQPGARLRYHQGAGSRPEAVPSGLYPQLRVKVTHPDLVRCFVTIPEASQLVLQAGVLGEGGENFVLDMGEPVRILDLAKDMITLFGLRPYEDIEGVFSGTRLGEKLIEVSGTGGETMSKTSHPKILIGRDQQWETSRIERMLTSPEAIVTREAEDEPQLCLADLVGEDRLVRNLGVDIQ